jgi:hypothetical protein
MSIIHQQEGESSLEKTQWQIRKARSTMQAFRIKEREIIVDASMKGNAQDGTVSEIPVVYDETIKSPEILIDNLVSDTINVGGYFPIFTDVQSDTIEKGPNVWRIDLLDQSDDAYKLRLFVGGEKENCDVYEITVLRKKAIEGKIEETRSDVQKVIEV